MWHLPADGPVKLYLNYLRWLLFLFPINAFAMAVVLVRTYKNSKFSYLYTSATLMFLAAFFYEL